MTAPPLAFSVDDFENLELVEWIDILLDGVLQKDVLSYDCRIGWVTRYARDAAGNYRLHPETARFTLETVLGSVKARWRSGAPAELVGRA